ncbi:MAG TPA: hypothetical protein PLU97_05465 [Candidatus Cryptobacteroides sp.]|nr:hypothetical protein [Candidatus Cryptobacteroides sp.]
MGLGFESQQDYKNRTLSMESAAFPDYVPSIFQSHIAAGGKMLKPDLAWLSLDLVDSRLAS